MADSSKNRTVPPPVPRCPACGRPRDARYRPFCSKLCRDRDFLGWVEGRYAVPAVEADDDSEGEPRREGEDG